MVKPLSVEKFGNDLLIRLDDGSRWRAVQAAGDLYLATAAVDPPPPNPDPGGGGFAWPFPLNLVTSEFGPRNGRLHAGIDFGNGAANISGTAIPASGAGTVVIAAKNNNHGGYGNAVVLDHGNGRHTLYGHMRFLPNGGPADVSVNVGQVVAKGQRLGGIGNTGASRGLHLHFETHVGGYKWDASARNPRQMLAEWNA